MELQRARRRHVDPWKDVVVQRREVARVHANGDGHVGGETSVQPDAPSGRAGGRRAVPRYHDRGRELAVDGEQVGGRIAVDRPSDALKAGDD